MVQPHGVGRVGLHLRGRTGDFAGVGIQHQGGWQAGVHFVDAASIGGVGRDGVDGGVVYADDHRNEVHFRIGADRAEAREGDGAVANTITVGVRIERIRTGVARINVGSSTRFHAVIEAISVIVAVGHKTGSWSFGCVVIAWQVVGKAIAVVISKTLQVEREGLSGAAVVRGRHRVGGVGQRSVDRAGDFAGTSVDGEVARQGRRDRPHGGAVPERGMEANWINRLVLNDRVRIVRIHAKVQLVRGRITALIGVNRVGLIGRIDRRCAANRTTRDAHAGRQSRVCFPCDDGGCGIPGVVARNSHR